MKGRNFTSFLVACFTLGIVLFTSGSALGSGFALIEQSVSGLGNAFSGGAAGAEDASTVFFNPAGMSRLDGTQIMAAGTLVAPSMKFHNEGSTHALQAGTHVPLIGDNGGDAGVARLVPNFYITKKINNKFTFGLGVNAPFGLTTEYDKTWIGRYHAINSEMTTIDINPSVSYRISEYLSAGAGINIQRIDAELSSAIDFGTLDAAGAFSALGLPAGALGLRPQSADGYVNLSGDNWAVGYNLGLLYELTPSTRMGVAYRSRIKHTLEGKAEFSNTPAALAAAPVFKNTGISADITVPDSLSISLFHRLSPKWAVMADFTWTNWSLFNELRVKFDNPYQADSVTTVDWRDSYRYSAGASYSPDERWTVRAGIAYDTTPIPDEEHRTPRIPDQDRFWTALGLGYKPTDAVIVDIGYAHLFVSDPKINKDPTGEDATRGGLKGRYDAHVDLLGLQVGIRF